MAHRTLELTLISASDLKDVNFFTTMDVYAVVSLAGDPSYSQRTDADRNCGRNPSWNATFHFPVTSDPAAAARLALQVGLCSERVLGDREIGMVHIPLKELLEGEAAASATAPRFMNFQVRTPSSGKVKGVLDISYRFLAADVHEKTAAPVPPFAYPAAAAPTPPPAGYPPMAYSSVKPKRREVAVADAWKPTTEKHHEPVVAYPAPSSAYPPPYPAPQPYGYRYPQAAPAAGNGYVAPPPAGYGYGYAYGYAAPQLLPPKKKSGSNFGAGMGMGLLGGALGGLLIGEAVSDASAYDAGYDAGFDDAGGFDFDF